MDYSDDDIIDSEEENLYCDDEDRESENYGFANAEVDIKGSQKSYVALKEEDIRKHQRDDIERVSTTLSVSQVEAIVLLLHYHWSVSKVEDEWFTDEERVRNIVGILKKPVVDVNGREVNILCGICFESYTREEIATVSCGHPYCNTCWTGYVTTKINNSSGCLRIKCPEPSCSAAVGQDIIDKVSNEEDKEKYYRYFLRSYVEEDMGRIKWCPSPGCEYAIDFGVGSGSGSTSYDISCLCSHSFCWNCNEDAHSPVDCETVSKWIFKNQDESENKTWILANSKACPKCKRPIEKNEGCNHMTCSAPCKHEFCWICLKNYNGHVACNRFGNEAEDKRTLLKKEIDRYMHYYERWVINQSSRLQATRDLEKLQSVQLKVLSDKQHTPETELEFTVEAWRQIIECRRVLKWTYAYGYYLPNHERAKRHLFEYLQGEAESGLERLHHCAETELKQFVDKSEGPTKPFYGFRMKLTGLTRVTKTYFENLVNALENGLADVVYSETEPAAQESDFNLYHHLLNAQFSHDEWLEDEWVEDYSDVV